MPSSDSRNVPANGASALPHVQAVREGDQGRERLLVYELSEESLGAGSSLGNDKAWVNSKATGALERLFSLDLGQVVFGALNLRYSSPQHGLMQHGGWPPASGEDPHHLSHPEVRVMLQRSQPGTFRIHPAYQEFSHQLPGGLAVTETLFLPKSVLPDPAVAYQIIHVRNESNSKRSIRILAFTNFRGETSNDIIGEYQSDPSLLLAWNESQPDWVRAMGFTIPATGYMTTHDVSRAYDPVNVLPLTNDTTAKGDLFGVLQTDLDLEPGEERRLAVILAFSPRGKDDAIRIFREAADFETALTHTIDYYRDVLDTSRLETPDPIINQGVQWCKANMIRVMGEYPVSKAFTNEPGVSSNVVLRDLAWFVYGNDWMLPEFSREMLQYTATKQYPNGKMCEYFSALDGHIEDYGLNINDDTPLFILAVCHHYHATGNEKLIAELLPAVEKTIDYMLSQRDERGLVVCSATGQNVWGISGWRNVIPNYTLSGAVTEINALCYGALKEAAKLNADLGRLKVRDQLNRDAESLKDAMNEHLLNPDNGMYYLNIDLHGNAHTDVTSDEVFPVMFKAAPDDVAFRIISRLNSPDFWTDAGLRVLSDLSPDYDPSSHVGLMGGVWPGVVFWYAFAAAKYHPEFMVRGLHEGYQNYLANPRKNNTVPGQFSEWFDGESLVNRGMRLSPWEPPRYLWAAVEGLAGVTPGTDQLSLDPRLPPDWKWLSMSRLPYRGREVSFFAAREEDKIRLYVTEEVESPHPTEVSGRNVSEFIQTWSADASVLAFQKGDVLTVCLANSSDQTLIVPWTLEGLLNPAERFRVRTFNSEYRGWMESGEAQGQDLLHLATQIEQRGFYILRFSRIKD